MKKIYWNKFPLIIKWYITSKCNLRCSHCYLTDYTQEPDHTQAMQIAEYLLSKKVYEVVFLGGEPLLRKDFCEIVQKLSSHNIRCTLSTNGTVIDFNYATKLKACGIENCQVSFEGITAKSNDYIRGEGSFKKAIDGVKYLLLSQIRVTIGLTLTSSNYEDIDQMVNFSNQYFPCLKY